MSREDLKDWLYGFGLLMLCGIAFILAKWNDLAEIWERVWR